MKRDGNHALRDSAKDRVARGNALEGTLESAEDSVDQAQERPRAIPKINVIDSRHWVHPDDKEAVGAKKESKPSHVEQLENKLEASEARLNETLLQHRAAKTEFEEARARLQREVSQEVERQRRTLLVDLLEVVDNLDRAVEAAETATEVATLKEGIELVRDQFLAKLGAFGVRRRQSLNEPFDPSLHDAVTNIPVDDVAKDGLVLGVVQEGYEINGETLRPARVAVGRVND